MWFYYITHTKKKPAKEQYTSQLGTKKLFEIRCKSNNRMSISQLYTYSLTAKNLPQLS